MPIKILLAGESWVSTATHIKGFDQFASVTFHTGADQFIAMLQQEGIDVTWLKAHEVPTMFPTTQEQLDAYDVVVLSDIGANSLLLHPDTWLRSRPMPNRLKLLRSFVRAGGGLLMVGGYYSFQGINGGARFHNTPVEDVLPVGIQPFDDRVEVPEGFRIRAKGAPHSVIDGLAFGEAPVLLGLNEIAPRPDGEVLLEADIDEGRTLPLLVTGKAGRGRTAAWASDIGPHWMPEEFLQWNGTPRLFRQLIGWLSGDA